MFFNHVSNMKLTLSEKTEEKIIIIGKTARTKNLPYLPGIKITCTKNNNTHMINPYNKIACILLFFIRFDNSSLLFRIKTKTAILPRVI